MPPSPETRFCIYECDYIIENNKPVVRLWGKTKEGKDILALDRDFTPYFYIELKSDLSRKEIDLLKERLMKLEIESSHPVKIEELKRKFLGEEKPLLKVFITLPVDVPKFRDMVKNWKEVRDEYEYGISFYKRYMIDKGITPMCWVDVEGDGDPIEIKNITTLDDEDYPSLRVLAFDMESAEERGSELIIMISLMDNSGFKKVLTHGKGSSRGYIEVLPSEEALLKRFIEIVQSRNPDIIAGYNTDRFDFVKLHEKSDDYNLPLVLGRDKSHMIFQRRGRLSAALVRGRAHIDIYSFVEHIMASSLSTEVLTLDRVATELIGKGKQALDWKEIGKAWRKHDISKIAKYCLKDSELTLKLAETVLPQIFELSRVTGQTLFDVSRMFYSQLVEWLYMRRAFEAGELVPNRPKYGEVSRRRRVPPYTGGYVHLPKEGIHNKIALFDFTSLYPSITITHNISPETLNCKCCLGSGHKSPEHDHYYCKKKKGFVTKVIEDIVNKRIEIKKKMKNAKNPMKRKALNQRQKALKILANASYGYYAYAGSRWYSRVCAESIASLGRMYIKNVIDTAMGMGLEVIYGDTDSLFLKIEKKKNVGSFLDKVNKSLPGVMELDFRGLYTSGIFVLGKAGVAAKKRYALIDSKGDIVIRGFEKVRRDWSSIAKETQEKVLMAVLKDKKPEKAVRIVRGIIKKLREGKIGHEELIIYTQLTKPIHEYEQIGPHVAVAKKIIEGGGQVRTGATIEYIITKGSGSISEKAQPAEEAKNYDPDYYIDHQVVPAALRILAGLGYMEKDLLKEGTKITREGQITLDKYIRR
jgi:DNA polymerase I/DNA polymerase-2